MRYTPYQTFQLLLNPTNVMGADLAFVEKEIVINTWLWRNYELTANDFRLSLKDEFESLLDDYQLYVNRPCLDNLLQAYSNFDMFMQSVLPPLHAVTARYSLLSNSIVALSFTLPVTSSHHYAYFPDT